MHRPNQLLFFFKDDCAPCAAVKPKVMQLALDTFTPIQLVDIAAHQELVEKYQVRSVPTVVIVDTGGNEPRRLAGFTGGMINLESIRRLLGT